jgi:hypothetical protein
MAVGHVEGETETIHRNPGSSRISALLHPEIRELCSFPAFMMRRLVGILLAASVAHLVVAGSDLVCATHADHALAREAPASMEGMHHHGDGGQTEKERCKIPARSDCCEAMTTCSTSAALAAVMDDEARPPEDGRDISFLADAPLTRVIPPDPPPPKA